MFPRGKVCFSWQIDPLGNSHDYSLKDMYNIFTAKRGKFRGAYLHQSNKHPVTDGMIWL